MNLLLHYVVKQSPEIVLKMLYLYPDDVNIIIRNNKGYNAFMLCCCFQPNNVVLELINKFSLDELNLQALNYKGDTPFILCCKYQEDEVVMRMFEKFTIKQLNIYKKNKNGKNAINILMLNRDKDFFNKIFEKLNYIELFKIVYFELEI